MKQNVCQIIEKSGMEERKRGCFMKVTLCLLMTLGFFSCTEKTQEQVDLEEIVQGEEVGNLGLK